MENLKVPVARPVPVGRLEWAQVGEKLYGVDAIGQVFIFEPVVGGDDRASALARFVNNILGRSTAAGRPRYRRAAS